MFSKRWQDKYLAALFARVESWRPNVCRENLTVHEPTASDLFFLCSAWQSYFSVSQPFRLQSSQVKKQKHHSSVKPAFSLNNTNSGYILACVAQMVEHSHGKGKVSGSSPVVDSVKKND